MNASPLPPGMAEMFDQIMARLDAIEAKLDNTPAPGAALEDRLLRLEAAADKLSGAAAGAPAMVAMATDTLDSAAQSLAAQGVDVDARARAGAALAEVVTRPGMLRLLDAVGNNADTLADAMDVLGQAPGALAMVADVVDGMARQLAESGVDLEGRLSRGVELIEVATRPAVLDSVLAGLKLVETAPDMAAMLIDMADDAVRDLGRQGVDVETRLKAMLGLLERASRPGVVAVMNQGLDLAANAPDLIAMGMDMFEDAIRDMDRAGIDMRGRIAAGLKALEAVTRPDTLALVTAATELVASAPDTAAMLIDMFDDLTGQMARAGIDLDTRGKALLSVVELATRPKTLSVLRSGLAAAEQAPELVQMLANIADDFARDAQSGGVTIEERLDAAIALLTEVSKPATMHTLTHLLQSDVFAPGAVGIIERAGHALQESCREKTTPVGLFGALGAARHADTQHALGFLLSFGKHFGAAMRAPAQIEA